MLRTQKKQKVQPKVTKNKKSTTTLSKRSFKSKKISTLSSSSISSDSITTISTPFKTTLKTLYKREHNSAFPEDYDPSLNPQAPPRDPTFDATKMLPDLDKTFDQHVMNRLEKPRRFDISDDEELYTHLSKDDANIDTKPQFEHFARAKQTLQHLHGTSGQVDFTGRDSKVGWLDPFNPPNLTYEHVKLLKNIDYSPLIKRASEGGMFTVEDVITILQEEGITDAFKTSMRREHAQDPVIYGKTFDVFNRGRKPCPLCLPDPTIDKVNRIHWTNVNLLRKFLSTSGMIIPRKVSGVCASHQKKLRYAIKNAKQLALLSFTSNWHVPLSYVDPTKFPSYEDQIAAMDVERERRLEIKQLFDNLVNDKRALLAGKTLEQIQAEKENKALVQEKMELSQQDVMPDEPIDDIVVEGTPEAQAMGASAIKTPGKVHSEKKLSQIALEEQHEQRVKQLQDRYQANLAKAGDDEVKAAQVTADYELEYKNITKDYEIQLAEENDENLDELRNDFGDLLDIDTFDVTMTFEQFLSRYNERIADKKVIPASHYDVIIIDSEDDVDAPTAAMKLRQQHVEVLQDQKEELEKAAEYLHPKM